MFQASVKLSLIEFWDKGKLRQYWTFKAEVLDSMSMFNFPRRAYWKLAIENPLQFMVTRKNVVDW